MTIRSLGSGSDVASATKETVMTQSAKATRQANQKPSRRKKGGPKGSKAPSASNVQAKPAAQRRGTKAEAIVALLNRKDGASLADLQDATGWQPHSVRGFLSGTVRKRMGLKLESSKSADGERRYALNGAAK